MKLLLISLQCF